MSSRDLRQILGPARFNSLPGDTQSVLLKVWETHSGGHKSELEKTRVDSEQKISALQKKNQELESQVAHFKDEQDKGQSSLDEYREQATAHAATAAKLTDDLSKLSAERDDFRRQFYNAKAERDDLAGLAERRQQEVERLHTKLTDITQQYNQAVNTRYETQARLDDLESKEVNIQFREKRLAEDRSFLESQIEMLKDEVEKRNEEVLTAKREAGIRQIELSTELADKTEKNSNLAREREAALEDREAFKRKAEMLTERLKEARDSESKLEDNYRAELKSQKKLAELYLEQSQENTQKTEDLTDAIAKLQNMLDESVDKYGKLEEHIDKVKADYKVEMDKGNETIGALKTELENANKLINTVKNKGLTEDAIEHLSPSAAQASRLLKSGVTLTGIYSQMVSLSEELTLEKDENKRLNEYMDQILVEIEERAPILKQQREDYEHAMAAVGGLTENLEAAREEVGLRRREAEDARRDLNSVEKDRNKLEQQVLDLGKQITGLVREVEAARAGGQVYEPPQTVDVSSLESVIEARLLTYRDVAELQQRNIELIAVVRQLSESRDQAESSLIEEKTAEVRQELDTALRQAEELRAARERQQKMVENLIKQRDLYKSMAAGKKDAGPSAAPQQVVESEEATNKISKLTADLLEARTDLADYKKEKGENYKMLEKDNSKLREQLLDARSQAAKLSSQEEYNTQKFNIAQANCESLKKQIDALEVRNKQLDGISAKHEESITALRQELHNENRKLSHAELQVDQLSQENSHLKSVEARLSAEKEVLNREKSSANQILANLQQIQINLERKDDQHRIRLTESNNSMSKELELLRKKLDEEQDHFKKSVRNWENSNKELRDKATREEEYCQAASQRANELTTLMETLKSELKEKTEELQIAESRLQGRGQLSSQVSATDTEGKNRYRDVEILLGKSKQEIKSLNLQLSNQKKKVEELQLISETAEKRMMESSKAMIDCKEEADKKIKSAEEGKVAAEKIAQEHQANTKAMEKKIEDLEAEVGAEGGELRERFMQTTKQLNDANLKIKNLESQDMEIRKRMAAIADENKEVQDKYQREVLLHAKDIEALNVLKTESEDKRTGDQEMEMNRHLVEKKISELKENHAGDLQRKSEEMVSLQDQLDIVCKQNEALMKQVEALSGQLSDLSASDGVLNTTRDMNTSNISNRSMDEDNASNDELMTIIKFLRKEKELVAGRLQVKEAELIRVERQLTNAQKQSQDIQNALEMERQDKNESMLTAGKHAELLRKVESLAALTDSNKMLRDEKERLENEVNTTQQEADQAKQKLVPLENKIKELDEKYNTLLVEKSSLQSETDQWKKRSDQLVEKSFKMNPEELKRLQDAEVKLAKQVTALTTEKQRVIQKSNTVTKELATVKQSNSTLQEELKTIKEEVEKKDKELKQSSTYKNALANITKQKNEIKKKLDDNDKTHKEEILKLKQQLEASEVKSKQAAQGDTAANKEKLEKIQAEKAEIEDNLKKKTEESKKLRIIGRDWKKKANDFEAEKKQQDDILKELKQKYESQTAEIETLKTEADEAKEIAEALNPETQMKLMQEKEDLEKEKEDLKKEVASHKERQEKAKEILQKLKTANTKLKTENVQLMEQSNTSDAGKKVIANLKKETQDLNEEIDKMKEEKEKKAKLLETVMKNSKEENQRINNELISLKEEKEALNEQIESLKTQLDNSAASVAPKPVAVAGMVHQTEQRKQAQPQAHIQPHRHQPPRDDFRPTQTASIRPMTQRPAAAVVLPTSQVGSSGQQESASVPVVSVSPSVSSAAAPQLPSTSQLDPMAVEFVPDRSAATSSDSGVEEVATVESARPDSVQASTSSPAAPTQSAQTSTSGATQTTASVQPTLKRPREAEAVTTVAGDDAVAQPSAAQKKARTMSVTEEIQQDFASEMIEAEDSQEGLEEIEIEEMVEVGNSEDQVVSSGPVESGNQGDAEADADYEEGEDIEEGEVTEDEEEEIAEPDLDDDDQMEGEESQNDAGASEDPQDIFNDEDLEEDGDNSSNVPSSSTGAVMSGSTPNRPTTFTTSNVVAPAQPFEVEVGEDSVVPSTPKLTEPRRNQDGFSEAVSSPQVPPTFQFSRTGSAVAGTSSSAIPETVETSTASLSGLEGPADRTSFDISQLTRPETGASPEADAGQPSEEALSEAVEIETSGSEAGATSREPEESGVSSSGTVETSTRTGRVVRTPITWNSPTASAGSSRQASGPASTSPQRTINRRPLERAQLARAIQQATAGTRGTARGAKRGTRGVKKQN